MNDLDNLELFLKIFQPSRIFYMLIGFFLLWVLVRLIKNSSEKLVTGIPGKRSFILQISTILIFLLYIVGTIVVIYITIRPPSEMLLAAGGSVAVAIGLALKDLMTSVIAGLILLFDRPFQVGDKVQIGDTYGEIKSIGLRAVRLATLDDNLVTIPNSRFLTDSVASGNAGEMNMMITVSVLVALDADLTKARNIIREIMITSRYIYLNKPFDVVSEEIVIGNMPVVKLLIKAYVIDHKYEKKFQSDLVNRVENVFREEKIQRPYINYREHPTTK